MRIVLNAKRELSPQRKCQDATSEIILNPGRHYKQPGKRTSVIWQHHYAETIAHSAQALTTAFKKQVLP